MNRPQATASSSSSSFALRRRLRQLSLTAGSICGVLILGLALAAPAAAADKGDRSITVSPSTGLSDGDTVHLEGSGFTPKTDLFVVECNSDATGAQGCNVASLVQPTTDDDGSFTADMTVKATFGDNDCTASTCVVQAAEGPSPDAPRGTSGPLKFAGAATSSSETTTSSSASSSSGSATTQESQSSQVGAGASSTGGGTSPQLSYTGTRTYFEVGIGAALIVLGGAALWLTRARPSRHAAH